MSTKPKTLETLQFTLELIKRIPRTHKVSAPELYRQLNEAGWQRDLRTVQRQLDELAQHFDIDRDDRSKPYGYQWKAAAKGLSLPGLNEKESLLLVLAEQHLRNLLPPETVESLQPFFQQARTNLGPHMDDKEATRAAREWMQKVRVVSTSQPLLPPKIHAGVFESVSSALYRNVWLDIDYVNAVQKHTSSRLLKYSPAPVQIHRSCRDNRGTPPTRQTSQTCAEPTPSPRACSPCATSMTSCPPITPCA